MALLFGSCPQCHQLLSDSHYSSGSTQPCPQCRAPSRLVLFPALAAPRRRKQQPEPLIDSEASSCLYHPDYKASSICNSCGAFICQLCEIHLQNEPICPACLERQSLGDKNRILKKNHYLWDNISLALALFVPASLALWFLSLFTAPCALYLAIRHWKDPGLLRKPSKLRLALAALLALLQIAAWILLFLYLLNALSKLGSTN